MAPNPPMTCWVWWVGGWFLVSFVLTMQRIKGVNLPIALSMTHLLFAVVGYVLVTQLESAVSWRLFRWVARAGVVVSAYAILQSFGADQFLLMANYDASGLVPNTRVVGTIGNPSHLAAYLSLVWAVMFSQRGRQWWIARGVLLWALYLTRAWGGTLAVIVVTLAWTWRTPRVFWSLVGLVGLGLGIAWIKEPEYYDLSGRLERWGLLLKMFRHTLITGAGPGALFALSQEITDSTHRLYHWRHAHNEYLQVLLEQGVVGLALVGWMLTDWAKKFWAMKSLPVVQVLGALFLAFLCNGLYNFPAHLWVTSSLGLLAYAGLYSVWSEHGRLDHV